MNTHRPAREANRESNRRSNHQAQQLEQHRKKPENPGTDSRFGMTTDSKTPDQMLNISEHDLVTAYAYIYTGLRRLSEMQIYIHSSPDRINCRVPCKQVDRLFLCAERGAFLGRRRGTKATCAHRIHASAPSPKPRTRSEGRTDKEARETK